MKNLKSLFLCSLVVILSFVFSSGCQGKARSNRKVITFACPDSSTDAGVLAIKKALTRYQKMHPEIKLETRFIARDYLVQVLNMIASGDAPDIFRMAPDSLPVFLKKDALMPLDDFIAGSSTFKIDDYFEATLWKYKYDGQVIGKGKIHGFGTDWSPDRTMFFNEDLFLRSGIQAPDKSLGWQEFINISKKLTVKQGQMKSFGSVPIGFTTLLIQAGGKLYSDDGKKCLLDSPQSIEALRYLQECYLKHKIHPGSADLLDTGMDELFQSERLGMFFSGRYKASTMQNTVGSKFKWSVAPTLHKEGRERVNESYGPYGWVMSSKTKSPEETWKLYEYMVYGDGVKMLAAVGYNIPIRKSHAFSKLFLDNPNHPQKINKIFLDEVSFTVPSAININVDQSRINKIMMDEMINLRDGNTTPEKAAQTMTKEINKLLLEGI